VAGAAAARLSSRPLQRGHHRPDRAWARRRKPPRDTSRRRTATPAARGAPSRRAARAGRRARSRRRPRTASSSSVMRSLPAACVALWCGGAATASSGVGAPCLRSTRTSSASQRVSSRRAMMASVDHCPFHGSSVTPPSASHRLVWRLVLPVLGHESHERVIVRIAPLRERFDDARVVEERARSEHSPCSAAWTTTTASCST
jgi:hypothetical protein